MPPGRVSNPPTFAVKVTAFLAGGLLGLTVAAYHYLHVPSTS